MEIATASSWQTAIRPATPADLPALSRLETCFPGDRISARSFRRFIDGHSAAVLVCETAGDIVANLVVLYRRNSSVARIYSLIVAPDYQQRGIARALLAAAENTAVNKGCRVLSLELRPDNQAALRLYHSLGYAVMQSRENFYEDGSTALCMSKHIGLRLQVK